MVYKYHRVNSPLERPLPITTFTKKDICPEDICPEGRLPRRTFVRKDICLEKFQISNKFNALSKDGRRHSRGNFFCLRTTTK
jgi:hypothetical protein